MTLISKCDAVGAEDLAEARSLSAAFVATVFSRTQQAVIENELRWEHAIEAERGARRTAFLVTRGSAFCDWCSLTAYTTQPVYSARRNTGLRCCRDCSRASRFMLPPSAD